MVIFDDSLMKSSSSKQIVSDNKKKSNKLNELITKVDPFNKFQNNS